MTIGLALQCMGVGLALAVVAWAASVRQRDASLVDRFWSWLIVAPVLWFAASVPSLDARAMTMLALATAWAARLSGFITWRNWGHGEDRRYVEIRARNEPGFAFKSLYLVFGLQAVLAWVVALPLVAGVQGLGAWTWATTAGATLAAFGIVFEAVADAQMSRFRKAHADPKAVMDRGLWRYSRHPNYFGEACVWWGLWLMAPTLWTVLSPVLMTVLLLKVSGVALSERDMGQRRPAYQRYVDATSSFIPWFPRKVPQ